MPKEDAPTLEQLEGVLGPDDRESASDTMRAVMDELGEPGPEGAGGGRQDVEGDSAAGEDDRPRDEKGRFAAKGESEDEGGEGPEAGEEGAEGKEAPEGGEEAAETSGDDQEVEPPHDWSVEEQERFRSLPNEARQIVLDRAKSAQEVEKKATDTLKQYEGVEEIIGPRREAWARNGMDERGALRQLFALSDLATQKPAEFVSMFVRERGLKPEDVFGQQDAQGANGSGAQGDDYGDPEVKALKEEIGTLKQQVTDLGGTLQTREQQEREARLRQISAEVDKFSTATDEKGNLKRPYYDQVRGLMGPLMQAGEASDLESAYDMACRAHPDVHAKIAAAEKTQAERDRAKEQRRKAEAAGKAGASVSGAPGDRERPEPTGDIREDMRRQFVEAGLS